MKNLWFGSIALIALAAAGPAIAADMPVKSPVYKAAPATVSVYNWTGFYVGGHVGWAWGDKDFSNPEFPDAGSLNFDVDGLLGGGQIGFNWQAGNWSQRRSYPAVGSYSTILVLNLSLAVLT